MQNSIKAGLNKFRDYMKEAIQLLDRRNKYIEKEKMVGQSDSYFVLTMKKEQKNSIVMNEQRLD